MARRGPLNTHGLLGPRPRLLAVGLLLAVLLASTVFQTTTSATPAAQVPSAEGGEAAEVTPSPTAPGGIVLPTSVPVSDTSGQSLSLAKHLGLASLQLGLFFTQRSFRAVHALLTGSQRSPQFCEPRRSDNELLAQIL